VRSALLALPELYGGPEVLDEAAARLPQDAEIAGPLDELRQLGVALADLPVSFDLSDLRGYNYHSGIVFAAYGADSPAALALGGRYDRVAEAFGRARPATGFSLDLRELVWRLPELAPMSGAILAPLDGDAALAEEVTALRARGEIVMSALPGHEGTWDEAGCDRQLVKRGDRWAVVSLQGE
jgi:ATP phosphoribosyltransferase regulatory subunit